MSAPFLTRDFLAELVAAHGFSIGDHSYGCPSLRWWGEDARLVIGRYCSIAENVRIFLGGNHRTDWVTTYPFPALTERWPAAAGIAGHPASKGDVVIGNDVWLGADSIIMSGVAIGDGAVVGAGAVVARNVPPYAIVVGNPARIARHRFSPALIGRLQALKWWNWPDDRVRDALPLLLSGDVEAFLIRYEESLGGTGVPAGG